MRKYSQERTIYRYYVAMRRKHMYMQQETGNWSGNQGCWSIIDNKQTNKKMIGSSNPKWSRRMEALVNQFLRGKTVELHCRASLSVTRQHYRPRTHGSYLRFQCLTIGLHGIELRQLCIQLHKYSSQ